MKGLKEFFRIIVTAVICFGMRAFIGNKNRLVKACMGNGNVSVFTENSRAVKYGSSVGEAFTSNKGASKAKSNHITGTQTGSLFQYKMRRRPLLKKVFFWLQGPGDRMKKFQNNKPPAGTGIPEETKFPGFYLVPE